MERSREPETWPSRRELSRRRSGGLEVALFWCDRTSAVTLTVADAGTGEIFEIEVPRAEALDAFHHPYVYLGARAPLVADA
jgi:hypothetical protein